MSWAKPEQLQYQEVRRNTNSQGRYGFFEAMIKYRKITMGVATRGQSASDLVMVLQQ